MSSLKNSEAGDLIGLYRQTVHELYRFVSRRSGGSRELAEDITQETYLRAMREWRSERRPDVPLAWLQTVARRLLLNHYRRKTPELIDAAQIDALFNDGPSDGVDAAALVYWGLARLGRTTVPDFYITHMAAHFGVFEPAVIINEITRPWRHIVRPHQ